MGSKRKVWLESPTQESYLFKNVRQDSIGSVYGDDWAEKLAAELAGLLGVPAAAVDLLTVTATLGSSVAVSTTQEWSNWCTATSSLVAANPATTWI